MADHMGMLEWDSTIAWPIGSVLTAEEWDQWVEYYEDNKEYPHLTLDRYTKEGE
jgi:hypothetical protein